MGLGERQQGLCGGTHLSCACLESMLLHELVHGSLVVGCICRLPRSCAADRGTWAAQNDVKPLLRVTSIVTLGLPAFGHSNDSGAGCEG